VKYNLTFVVFVLFILATSFVGQHMRVYAYLFDNTSFTEKHCVNKDQPNSTCKGACQIRKLAEDAPTETPASSIEIKSIDLYVENQVYAFRVLNFDLSTKSFFVYNRFTSERNSAHFPQPPDDL